MGAVLVFAGSLYAGDIDSVRTTVQSWRRDWEARNLERYMAHYHPGFRSNGLNRSQWRQRKAHLFQHSGPLSIEVSDLWVVKEKRRAVARFLQHYHSRDLTETGEKRLTLVETQGQWKIVQERWRPIGECIPRKGPGTQPPAPLSGQASERTAPPLRVALEPGSERLYIDLGKFFIPMVSVIDQGPPRIIIDIQGVSRWKGKANRAVNGTWIRNIRTHLHREGLNRLRIVLDLNTGQGLNLNQTYFGAKDIFCLEITKAAGPPHPPKPATEDGSDS